jgi:hypothetical protein
MEQIINFPEKVTLYILETFVIKKYEIMNVETVKTEKEIKFIFDLKGKRNKRSIVVKNGFDQSLFFLQGWSHFEPRDYAIVDKIPQDCNSIVKMVSYEFSPESAEKNRTDFKNDLNLYLSKNNDVFLLSFIGKFGI